MDSKTEEKSLKYWLIFAGILLLLVLLGLIDGAEAKLIIGASFIGMIIAGIAMNSKK